MRDRDRRESSGSPHRWPHKPAQDAVECAVDEATSRARQSSRLDELLRRGRTMPDHTAEGQLRRELDGILVRLERHERAAQTDARADDGRLVGDMFADAQVIASRNLDALGYERLSRRARELVNALE